jgi:hypothetical protein
MHPALTLLNNAPLVYQQIKAHAYHHGTPPAGAGPPAKEVMFSDDFASLLWFGTLYHFSTPLQAAVIREYYRAWASGVPQLRMRTALGKAGSLRSYMGDLFAGHPALGTLLVRVSRGVYRLESPVYG